MKPLTLTENSQALCAKDSWSTYQRTIFITLIRLFILIKARYHWMQYAEILGCQKSSLL